MDLAGVAQTPWIGCSLATARLVAATVTDRPHVRLYRLWEGPEAPGTSGARRPGGGRHPGHLCALAGAQGPPADPYRWQRSLLGCVSRIVGEFGVGAGGA